jgi:5-methylcytosine-specific restriction endonuclease McrA
MKKKQRLEVFNKYNGLCAYTGKTLEQDWQVDHVQSRINNEFQCYNNSSSIEEIKQKLKECDYIDNLLPALRIVNHYKRGHGLEGFRRYMLSFHKRLQKLPKKTTILKTEKRKEYMYKVASAFDITIDKPFSGQFYFETLEK